MAGEAARAVPALEQLLATADAARQRRMAVLSGEPAWARARARTFLATHPSLNAAWIGDTAPARDAITTLPYTRAHALVGTDLGGLVYDAFCGFDPDAFGAVTGTVLGGGLILLLVPPLADWPRRSDPAARRVALAGHPVAPGGSRLLRRLADLLTATADAWVWCQGCPPPVVAPPEPTPEPQPKPANPDCVTRDQADAVAALVRAADRERAVTVLTADRGRGKSAALGLAAGRLVRRQGARIVVTAPRRAAAAPVFRHARAVLELPGSDGATIRVGRGEVEYTAPDELIHRPRPADLLLVDEAAGIPAPLLASLLRRYPRVAFATTVHGYEGTGRGFVIRFRASLDRLAPGWRQLTLTTPVRWAPDDPVERLVARALLLDADAADEALVRPGADAAYQRLDRDTLAGDEALLSQVFGLLVNAHYRTTPTDLRNLLDGPTVGVHVLRSGDTVLAAAITVDEGPFTPALGDAVWLGLRRPHGHLLPQSLSFHGGLRQATDLRHRRIMRIAVHAAARRRGHGSRLVRAIAAAAADAQVDAVGTSFGATPELLRFWQHAGFTLARIGTQREASSGTHAAMLIHGLSEAGRGLQDNAGRRLAADLPVLLDGPLADLEADLRRALPGGGGQDTAAADSEDYLIGYGFAHGNRTRAACLGSLVRIARQEAATLTPVEQSLLYRAPGEPGEPAGGMPRRRGERLLREAFVRILAQSVSPACQEARRAFSALGDRAEDAAVADDYALDDRGRVTWRRRPEG